MIITAGCDILWNRYMEYMGVGILLCMKEISTIVLLDKDKSIWV